MRDKDVLLGVAGMTTLVLLYVAFWLGMIAAAAFVVKLIFF